jgi:uncharacterized integral membrane protein
MDTLTALTIIALAALMHASFQLSVSMVTLLSSHSIGSKRSGRHTLRLAASFLAGATIMTTLIVSLIAYVASVSYKGYIPSVVWALVCGAMIGLGTAVWTFYYRKQAGTSLWIPRGMARFLSNRTKATSSLAESFSLGLTGVVGELLFILAPSTAAALSLSYLPHRWQLPGLMLYVVIASLGVGVVVVLVGSGHKISQIQRWRENNKRFLQFIAGSGFLVLGAYIYVNTVAVMSLSNGAFAG